MNATVILFFSSSSIFLCFTHVMDGWKTHAMVSLGKEQMCPQDMKYTIWCSSPKLLTMGWICVCMHGWPQWESNPHPYRGFSHVGRGDLTDVTKEASCSFLFIFVTPVTQKRSGVKHCLDYSVGPCLCWGPRFFEAISSLALVSYIIFNSRKTITVDDCRVET